MSEIGTGEGGKVIHVNFKKSSEKSSKKPQSKLKSGMKVAAFPTAIAVATVGGAIGIGLQKDHQVIIPKGLEGKPAATQLQEALQRPIEKIKRGTTIISEKANFWAEPKIAKANERYAYGEIKSINGVLTKDTHGVQITNASGVTGEFVGRSLPDPQGIIHKTDGDWYDLVCELKDGTKLILFVSDSQATRTDKLVISGGTWDNVSPDSKGLFVSKNDGKAYLPSSINNTVPFTGNIAYPHYGFFSKHKLAP